MEGKLKIRDHEDEFVSKSNIFKGPFIWVNFLKWYVFLEFQAKNKITKEIVAIKKMSYSGKQAAEVSPKTTHHWFINNGVYTNIDLITGTVQAS